MPRDTTAAFDREELSQRLAALRTDIRLTETWLTRAEAQLPLIEDEHAKTEAALVTVEQALVDLRAADVVSLEGWEHLEEVHRLTADALLDLRVHLEAARNEVRRRRGMMDAWRADVGAVERELAEWGQVVPFPSG